MNKVKVELKNIFKIFGKDPHLGMKLIKKGYSKQQLLEENQLTVGINNLSLSVNEGEFFVIMGLSGSGKSTLIRHINRLINATSGDILIDGDNVTNYSQEQLIHLRRTKVSMVFQKFGLLPHKTILDNVGFGLEVRGESKVEIKEKALKWIDVVGLNGYEGSFPRNLSGGMQQRVGLARALAVETDILMMDEPFSALDPLIRAEMQDVMLELKKKVKKTIIFVTHDLEEAIKLADRMMILKAGEVVQMGTPKEIIDNPENEYIKKFIEGANL